MKTPMQEMLEWVRATLPMDLDWPMLIEHKAESLLEKEKEVIIDAFISGDNSNCLQEQDSKLFAEQYYNQTFNTNEK